MLRCHRGSGCPSQRSPLARCVKPSVVVRRGAPPLVQGLEAGSIPEANRGIPRCLTHDCASRRNRAAWHEGGRVLAMGLVPVCTCLVLQAELRFAPIWRVPTWNTAIHIIMHVSWGKHVVQLKPTPMRHPYTQARTCTLPGGRLAGRAFPSGGYGGERPGIVRWSPRPVWHGLGPGSSNLGTYIAVRMPDTVILLGCSAIYWHSQYFGLLSIGIYRIYRVKINKMPPKPYQPPRLVVIV